MKRKAFTLIELLVVIGIIAILAALLAPAVNKAIKQSRMTGVMAHGKGIVQSLLASDSMDANYLPTSWGSNAYESSTAFWRWAVTNGYIDSTFALFTAPGLVTYAGAEARLFSDANNAWCIAQDMAPAKNDAPLIFTRNLDIGRLDEPAQDHLTANVPFGLDGVVVVTRGCSGFILKPADLAERFNPVHATNAVLRPAP